MFQFKLLCMRLFRANLFYFEQIIIMRCKLMTIRHLKHISGRYNNNLFINQFNYRKKLLYGIHLNIIHVSKLEKYFFLKSPINFIFFKNSLFLIFNVIILFPDRICPEYTKPTELRVFPPSTDEFEILTLIPNACSLHVSHLVLLFYHNSFILNIKSINVE